jgi:hypothetical protein
MSSFLSGFFLVAPYVFFYDRKLVHKMFLWNKKGSILDERGKARLLERAASV